MKREREATWEVETDIRSKYLFFLGARREKIFEGLKISRMRGEYCDHTF